MKEPQQCEEEKAKNWQKSESEKKQIKTDSEASSSIWIKNLGERISRNSVKMKTEKRPEEGCRKIDPKFNLAMFEIMMDYRIYGIWIMAEPWHYGQNPE